MTIYLQDADVTIHQGDVLDELRKLPDESVHMCCTSPPFYGLRDYGTGTWEGGDEGCDHGSGRLNSGHASSDPSGYDVARAAGAMNNQWFRSSKYMSQGHAASTCKCGARRVDQQIGLEATPDLWVARLVEVFREVRRVLRADGTLWVEIGDSYASGTSGGYRMGEFLNPPGYRDPHPARNRNGTPAPEGTKPKDLIGAPWLLAFALRADGWYLRSEIIWAKPNPMPESVTDRPTTSHSRVFLLAKQPRYFYDAEAIREPMADPEHVAKYGDRYKTPHLPQPGAVPNGNRSYAGGNPEAGRNRRSVWTVATQPYPEAHFATWPEALCRGMILAGCPEGGTVLDCFGGSGTTAFVARKLGRRAVLIELNETYCELAAKRLAQQSLLVEGTK